jgi:hypothetical protein
MEKYKIPLENIQLPVVSAQKNMGYSEHPTE